MFKLILNSASALYSISFTSKLIKLSSAPTNCSTKLFIRSSSPILTNEANPTVIN